MKNSLKNVQWFLTIDTDCKHDIDHKEVDQFIHRVLQDPNGWTKFGYIFQKITCSRGIQLRRKPDNRNKVFHVRVSTNDTIKKDCKFGGLSCADMLRGTIYLNLQRYLGGSIASRLPIWQYRQYMVNHEFGHLLGRGHVGCSDNVDDACPVMYQQTISKGCCKGNPVPLDWE
jgi:hypothetical protein